MHNRKEMKLYNMIMPLWFLILMPYAWLIVLPLNFCIDLLVLTLAMRLFGVQDMIGNLKKTIFRVWILGFAADFVGCLFMLLGAYNPLSKSAGVMEKLQEGLMWNPLLNVYSIIWTTICIIIAGILIYQFHYKIALKKADLEAVQKKKVALMMAAFTAPYLLYIPTDLLYK